MNGVVGGSGGSVNGREGNTSVHAATWSQCAGLPSAPKSSILSDQGTSAVPRGGGGRSATTARRVAVLPAQRGESGGLVGERVDQHAGWGGEGEDKAGLLKSCLQMGTRGLTAGDQHWL